MFGLLPQINKPQIWVEEADADRARPHLDAYERRLVEREEQVGEGPPIVVVCEECQHTSSFPASRLGRVEMCPSCGAFVDVGDDPGIEGWDAEPEADVE